MPDEEISLSEAARISGVSPSTLQAVGASRRILPMRVAAGPGSSPRRRA